MILLGLLLVFALYAEHMSDKMHKVHTRYNVYRDTNTTTYKISEIKKALRDYRIKTPDIFHGLPCPAKNKESVYSDHFGVSDTCAAVPGDIVMNNTNSPSYQQIIGAVPVRTLGLPDDFTFDEWGNKLIYAVDTRFTTSPWEQAHGDIVTAHANGSPIYDKYSAVLMSIGPNGIGGFNKAGTLNTEHLDYNDIYNGLSFSGAYTMNDPNHTSTQVFPIRRYELTNPKTFAPNLKVWIDVNAQRGINTTNMTLRNFANDNNIQSNNPISTVTTSGMKWLECKNKIDIPVSAYEAKTFAVAVNMKNSNLYTINEPYYIMGYHNENSSGIVTQGMDMFTQHYLTGPGDVQLDTAFLSSFHGGNKSHDSFPYSSMKHIFMRIAGDFSHSELYVKNGQYLIPPHLNNASKLPNPGNTTNIGICGINYESTPTSSTHEISDGNMVSSLHNFPGDIGEMLIYNARLNNTTPNSVRVDSEQEIQQYLQDKWEG